MYPSFEMNRSSQIYRSVVQMCPHEPESKGIITAMRRSWLAMLAVLICSTIPTIARAQTPPARIAQADERYKVDILLVVAHPDDEGAATPYLARAIDDGKRVAVAYGTRGSE
jgi:hypothetical protein